MILYRVHVETVSNGHFKEYRLLSGPDCIATFGNADLARIIADAINSFYGY